MDEITARNRSYSAAKIFPNGSIGRIVTSVRGIEAGKRVIVSDQTNAGFNGITCTMTLWDGTKVYNVSMGYLDLS